MGDTDIEFNNANTENFVSNNYFKCVNRNTSYNFDSYQEKMKEIKKRLELSMCRTEISRLSVKRNRNNLLGVSTSNLPVAMKMKDFFCGKRNSLTSELEESRKRLRRILD